MFWAYFLQGRPWQKRTLGSGEVSGLRQKTQFMDFLFGKKKPRLSPGPLCPSGPVRGTISDRVFRVCFGVAIAALAVIQESLFFLLAGSINRSPVVRFYAVWCGRRDGFRRFRQEVGLAGCPLGLAVALIDHTLLFMGIFPGLLKGGGFCSGALDRVPAGEQLYQGVCFFVHGLVPRFGPWPVGWLHQ